MIALKRNSVQDSTGKIYLDGKSHTGASVFVGQGCVLAASKKQRIVTKASTEAELVALSYMIALVENCDEFVRSLGYEDIISPLILQDNTSTIFMVTQGGGKPRTKHLRVRQYLIKDKVDAKDVEISYIHTEKMVANGPTKAIQGDRYNWIIDRIMGADNDHSPVDRGPLSGHEK
jgi:uncharacterized protein YndB with AHSA1/START domain